MGLTFADLEAELASRLRLTTGQTEQKTLIDGWINQSLLDIQCRSDWPWTLSREIVQTVIDKTDGTVAASVGGTTVTGTDTAFASADVGKFIQFSTSDDWYKITAVASATSLTIESPFVGTTAATEDTYTIRKIFYSCSSSVERILSVKQALSPRKLSLMHYKDWARLNPGFGDDTGEAEAYILYGEDSSGYVQFSIYPHPEAIYNLELMTKLRATGRNAAGTLLTTLSTGTDTPLLPSQWREVCIDGALMRGYEYIGRVDENDRRSDMKAAAFERGIARMLSYAEPTSDWHPIIESSEAPMGRLGPLLPENYDARDR